MTQPSSMRTELGRARGLGSAHHGIQHWWLQRLSAIALLPLSLWLIFSALQLAGHDALSTFDLAKNYLAHPFHALMAALLSVCLFQHLQLGVQIVIEDYVHHEGGKFVALIALKFLCFSLAAACLLAIVLIAAGR